MRNIVAELDKEIARLKEARALLTGAPAGHSRRKATGERKMSAAGRRRISEAMKKRWAERKKAAKK
ncbi:MAG TPA: hypothetical protein VHT24_08790 [Pseudacidobacterium sp.]|nr:hypothetical protein [Pseudacidobacterium sp.]